MSEIVITKISQELVFNFNGIIARSELGIQAVKDISEFMKKRAEIESEYAKKLNQHYKTTPGAGVFTKDPPITKESKTLKDALLGIAEKGLQVSDQHLEISNKIINDICKTLDNWIKTKDQDRKKIIGEGLKLIKSLADNKANVQKNKANYEKLWKDTDSAKDAVIKAEKDEINQPDNKKLNAVTKKATENFNSAMSKAKSSESAYQTSVDKFNEELNSFKSDKMPQILEQFQQWEQDRWSTLLGIVKSFATIQETLPASVQKGIDDLQVIVEAANFESDIKELVSVCKKEEKDEENIQFTPYKSKHEDIVTSDSAPKPTTTSTPSTTTTTTTTTTSAPSTSTSTSSSTTSTTPTPLTTAFSTQTAEEKIEEQNKAKEKEKEKEETKEQKEARLKKIEDDKKKADEVKAKLFGSLDNDEDEKDMFT